MIFFRKYSARVLITCLLTISPTFLLFSQLHNNQFNPYNWFDETLGNENIELYNGALFVDKFKVDNEKHRFFETDFFLKGDISFDGNTYFDQEIKYDLFEDELLINPKATSSVLLLRINSNKVDSFSLGSHKFINIKKTKDINYKNGFYELLFKKNQILILKKYKKTNQGKIYKNIFYEFKLKTSYFVLYNSNLFSINSKRDFYQAFPNQKKNIKEFYQKNYFLNKTDPDNFMKMLIKEIITSI